MAIQLKENPYRGINAHFNSYLQAIDHGWPTFHNDHIGDLKRALNEILPDNYYAVTEESLQIEVLGEDATPLRPDVTVLYQRGEERSGGVAIAPATPTLETPLLLPEEDYLSAILIYKFPDEAVTRLELLSPTNKTTHRKHYLMTRRHTLNTGLKLVELDYLHETPQLFHTVLPDYSRHQPNAFAYSITVTDPTPTAEYETGIVRYYCFHVDDPFPAVPIPLLGQESILLDFKAVYDFTCAGDRRVAMKLDYAEPPINFEAYSEGDKARILAVMERVQHGQEK
jgi:hypothetical protein